MVLHFVGRQHICLLHTASVVSHCYKQLSKVSAQQIALVI